MPIRSQLEIDTIIGNGQETLGNLAYRVVLEKNTGRYDKRAHQDKIYRLILLDNYLRTIIDPDTEEIKPYLLLTENDIKFNKLLDAIYKLSDIFDVAGVPITGRRRLPLVFDQVGQPGTPGVEGAPGSDANIVVESDSTYDNMSVIEEVTGPNSKKYKIGYAPYVAPTISVALSVTLREVGIVVSSLTITVTSTKGRELITRRQIVSPGGFTLANPDINNSGPQAENVFAANVSANTTYTAEVEDDDNTIASASASIQFVYPFLYGAADNTTPSPDFYQGLTKLVQTKSDKALTLNGTNKYFFFGYPASYGSLTRILDQNGFNVTAEWTEIAQNVNSANLDNNWTGVAYKFYRTTLKTTINNAVFTFDFP